jgi:hypothetical protein
MSTCEQARPPDVGMPFGYPRISIPGPAQYRGGQIQGLDKIDLETKKGKSNTNKGIANKTRYLCTPEAR